MRRPAGSRSSAFARRSRAVAASSASASSPGPAERGRGVDRLDRDPLGGLAHGNAEGEQHERLRAGPGSGAQQVAVADAEDGAGAPEGAARVERGGDVEALFAQGLLRAVQTLDEVEGGGAAQGVGALLDV